MYILHLALKTFRNRSSFYFKIGYLLPVRLRNKSVLKPTTFLSRVQNMVKLGRFKKIGSDGCNSYRSWILFALWSNPFSISGFVNHQFQLKVNNISGKNRYGISDAG